MTREYGFNYLGTASNLMLLVLKKHTPPELFGNPRMGVHVHYIWGTVADEEKATATQDTASGSSADHHPSPTAPRRRLNNIGYSYSGSSPKCKFWTLSMYQFPAADFIVTFTRLLTSTYSRTISPAHKFTGPFYRVGNCFPCCYGGA